MLTNLLNDKIKEKGLSNRAAAREVGIAHTTLQRFLAGQPFDMDTVLKISKYLDIAPDAALNSLPEKTEPINDLVMVLQSEPELAEAFMLAVKELKANRLSKEDLMDIIEFATYKIQSGKNKTSK
jgi:transcriptional regulator with XRE-family HTH domain